MANEQALVFEQYSFETQVNMLRNYIIDYVTHHEANLGDRLYEAITNNGELLGVMVEAFAAYTADRTRKLNVEAGELFRVSAKTEAGVDRLVSNAGLTRMIVIEATPTSPAIMEDNESLLTRYDLSHYQANTTGTRYGYKFHALCFAVGNTRPSIDIKRIGNQVIQTFTFNDEVSANIHDIEFRTIESGTGKVIGAITPVPNKTPDISGLLAYMKRTDIAQETDILSIKLATERGYTVTVNVYTNDDPRYAVNTTDLDRDLNAMIESKYCNSARVSDHDFSYIVKRLGAYDVDVIGLDEPLICSWDEYAVCKGLTVNVLGKR